MEQATKVDDHYESREFYTGLIQTTSTHCITIYAKIGDDSFINYSHIRPGGRITKIDLPTIVKYKLMSTHPFTYTIGGVLLKDEKSEK